LEFDFDNHQDHYNNLEDVVHSSDSVKANPAFSSVLLEVGEVLVRYQLHEQIGVRLLHRHNELREGEFMIEDAGTLADGTAALITTRQALENPPSELTPTIWKCGPNGEITALEFCTKIVRDLDGDFFARNKEPFAKFHELVSAHGLEKYLGLCLLAKNALEHDKETSLMVENTDVERVANIVTLKPRATFDRSTAIETVWDFSSATKIHCYPQVCSFCTPRSVGHETSRHRWHEVTGD
jgi:hypothetical protein